MKIEPIIASKHTKPALAGTAIAAEIKKEGEVHVQAIGAVAVNQMVKAVACAQGFLEKENIETICKIKFEKLENETIAMKIIVIRFGGEW